MKNSKLILLLLFSIYKLNLAQLSIDAFTNKDNYEYGEQIELYCKITNNSDSTFEFLPAIMKLVKQNFLLMILILGNIQVVYQLMNY